MKLLQFGIVPRRSDRRAPSGTSGLRRGPRFCPPSRATRTISAGFGRSLLRNARETHRPEHRHPAQAAGMVQASAGFKRPDMPPTVGRTCPGDLVVPGWTRDPVQRYCRCELRQPRRGPARPTPRDRWGGSYRHCGRSARPGHHGRHRRPRRQPPAALGLAASRKEDPPAGRMDG